MLIEDNLNTILLTTDIDTIKSMSLVDKNWLKCCNDTNFWKLKFNHDNLPIITSSLITIDEWIQEYKLVLYCKNMASNILLVNYIESKQTYNASKRINLFDDRDKYTNTILPESITDKPDIIKMQIEVVNKKEYIVLYYTETTTSLVTATYDEVLNIFIKTIYHDDHNIVLRDNMWEKPFILTEKIEYNDSVSDYDLVLIQRQTIYDTLKNLDLLLPVQ